MNEKRKSTQDWHNGPGDKKATCADLLMTLEWLESQSYKLRRTDLLKKVLGYKRQLESSTPAKKVIRKLMVRIDTLSSEIQTLSQKTR